MKRHVERGVGVAGGLQHQIDDGVHLLRADTEIWKAVFQRDRQQAMRPFAHRAGIQQCERGRGFRICRGHRRARFNIFQADGQPN
jgi:hypothetical protein